MVHVSAFDQAREIARRSVVSTMRRPAQIVPALIFPMFLVAINSSGLDAATKLPGFPTDSYLTFALAVPFIQSGIFSLLNAGTDLARDIETGFMDRMALTPISRAALIAGELGGVIVQGVLFGTIYLVVGLAAGSDFGAGAAGVPLLILLAGSIALALGCVGMFVAARVGDSEVMQSTFPVFFMFMFFSSMAIPRPLIEKDWFRTIADVNPVSYLIEGIRGLFIGPLDWGSLATAFGVCAALTAIFLTGAARALGGRLGR